MYGGFCFAIVIGDEGWTKQEIHCKTRGILTGETVVSHREADLTLVRSGRILTPSDQEALEEEVRERLRPVTYGGWRQLEADVKDCGKDLDSRYC